MTKKDQLSGQKEQTDYQGKNDQLSRQKEQTDYPIRPKMINYQGKRGKLVIRANRDQNETLSEQQITSGYQGNKTNYQGKG